MNRGGLTFFGAVHRRDKVSNSPRRFSASHALQALRRHDPVFEETKQDVQEAAPPKTKRFSSPANILPSKIEPLVKEPEPPKSDNARPKNNNTTSDNASTTSAAERRRSSRKSVNGMVIEIDFEDDCEMNMFEQCEDYEEDYKPDMTRTASNESLEELRTRLEALEHERQQLPEHDDYGWGVECMRKQLIEALESSSSLENRNSSQSALRGIPEFSELQDDLLEEGDEDEEEDAASVPSRPSQQARRSTVRSSVHGLVLEYDWSSGSESEEEEEPHAEEE